MKKGILREKRSLFTVYPEGNEYYEVVRGKEGTKEIEYLDERVPKEEFACLMKKGMKYVNATVLDPKYRGGLVYYFEKGGIKW